MAYRPPGLRLLRACRPPFGTRSERPRRRTLFAVSASAIPAQSSATSNGSALASLARRPADRRRVGSALLPRDAHDRRVVRAGAARAAVRARVAAVHQRRRAVCGHAGARSPRPGRGRRSRGAGDRGPGGRDAAGPPGRGVAPEMRRGSTPRRWTTITRCSGAARELATRRSCPTRLAFDVEKLTWEMNFFVAHFLEAYRGVDIGAAARDAAVGGTRSDRRGTGGRTARPLPPRLSQPQSDGDRRRPGRHRLPGRPPRAGYLRPGVASARLVRRSPRHRAVRSAGPLPSRLDAERVARGVRRAVRSDGHAAQSQGARHVRLSGGVARQPGVRAVRAPNA